MRINAPVTTALLSSLALTGHVLAEESKTGSAGLPSFTVFTPIPCYFLRYHYTVLITNHHSVAHRSEGPLHRAIH